jgi:tetratricopeptide (TPR) repeat protein
MLSKTFHLAFILGFTINSFAQVSDSQNAKTNYDKQDYKEAIKLYSKVIQNKDATYLDYYYRANAFLVTKNLQGAYDDYTSCIHLSNDFSEAYLMRGSLLINQEQIQEALNDLNMAVKYAKNDTVKIHAYSSRAGAKLYTQNYESAMRDCFEALKIDSVTLRAKRAYVNLSTCYGYMNDSEKSLKILKKMYALDSADVAVIGNLGYELANFERYSESVYYFDRALKLRPNDAFALSNKSYAYLKLGKLDEALELIEKSVKYDPSNSYAYKNLGLIYLEKKNKAKACEAFQTALKKGFSAVYGKEVINLVKENCN